MYRYFTDSDVELSQYLEAPVFVDHRTMGRLAFVVGRAEMLTDSAG